jgi:predicted aspartyl protease
MVGDDIDSAKTLNALWDTGAMITCISKAYADAMGLCADGTTIITGANNEPFETLVYSVQIKMGALLIPFIRVAELPMDGTGRDVIIGMDIMKMGDLVITNYGGKTTLTFRTPSLETIDYVEELKMQEKCDKVHALMQKKKILTAKCACGSKKDYSNCHAKTIYRKRLDEETKSLSERK